MSDGALRWHDWVAVYAAFLSTAVFIWQIFTWLRNGPRLRLSVIGNMKMSDDLSSKNSYIVINASNVGNADTTITHVVLFSYSTWLNYLRKKTSFTAIINSAPPAHSVPHVLKAGATFLAMGSQDDHVVKLARNEKLYGGVIHSVGRRPLLRRLHIPQLKSEA